MLLVFRNEYMVFTMASFLLHTVQTVEFLEIPITKYLWSQEQSGTQNKIKHLYVHMLTDIRNDKWHKWTLNISSCS